LERFLERRKKLVRVNRIVQKRVRHSRDGVNVVGDVNAAITSNVGEGGTTSSRLVTRQSIAQRSSKKTGRSQQSFSTKVDRDVE